MPNDKENFHDVVRSVGERFQEHPLDLVNEDMLHYRLITEFKHKMDDDGFMRAELVTLKEGEWGTKWKMKIWDDMDKFGEVSRLRTEVNFEDWNPMSDKGHNSNRNYFDIVLFDRQQDSLKLISKSDGPGNWFSSENDVSVVAEIKHSKTYNENHFYKCGKGAKDIRHLSRFPGENVERVFIFADLYPLNYHKDKVNSKDMWEELEKMLKSGCEEQCDNECGEFDNPVTIYYIPRDDNMKGDWEGSETKNEIEIKKAHQKNGKITLDDN